MDAGRCQEADYDEQGYRLKDEVMNCIEEAALDYHEQATAWKMGLRIVWGPAELAVMTEIEPGFDTTHASDVAITCWG